MPEMLHPTQGWISSTVFEGYTKINSKCSGTRIAHVQGREIVAKHQPSVHLL